MGQNRTIVSYNDFTGGLNDTLPPDRMKDNELEIADNIDLSVRGGFSYRNGTINTNTISFADSVRYLFEYPLKDGSVIELSVMSDKKLYETTGGTKRFIKQLANADIDHIIYRNAVYFLDGEDYYSYGAYDYNTQLGATDIKSGDIVYNNPVSTGTNPGTVKHYYQAVANMTAENLGTSDYGDTAKWTDVTHATKDIPDVVRSVIGSTEIDNDLSPIKKCRYIEIHPKSLRVFTSGNPEDSGCVYFSENGLVNYFKMTNKLYPTGGEGEVKAIRAIYHSMIIGYSYGWYEYSGIDETNWQWLKLPIPYGPVNNKVVELTPASFTFLSHNGLWKASIGVLNSSIVVSSENTLIFSLSDGRVETTIKSISDLSNTCSVFANGKYYLAYSETQSNVKDKVLVYDFVQNNFVRYTDLLIYHLVKKLDGELYFGSLNYVMKFDKTYLNDINPLGEEVPINLNVRTVRYGFGAPFNMKLFHRFFFSSSQGADIGNELKMWLKVDYSMSQTHYINLNNESFIWGDTEWGKAWGIADIASQELGLRQKGIRIQCVWQGDIINSMNNIVVYGIGFDVSFLRAKVKNMGTKRLIDANYNMID